MKVKTSQLVRRAMMLLDEDLEELELAQTFGDPGMELRQLASELVEEAVTKTLTDAEPDSVDETLSMDTSRAAMLADGTVETELPADWLRPVDIMMDGWERPLHDCREPQPVTRRLTLPGARILRRDGRRLLSVTPGTSSHGELRVEYLPRPDITGATVWIPRSLVNAAARQLADMVKAVVTD